MSIGKKNQTLQWVPKSRVHPRSHVLLPRQSEIRSQVTVAKRKSGSTLAHRHSFDSNSRQATLAPMKTLPAFFGIRVNRTWGMQFPHVPREVTGKCSVNESVSFSYLLSSTTSSRWDSQATKKHSKKTTNKKENAPQSPPSNFPDPAHFRPQQNSREFLTKVHVFMEESRHQESEEPCEPAAPTSTGEGFSRKNWQRKLKVNHHGELRKSPKGRFFLNQVRHISYGLYI